ncbi:Eco57I restriction-modification methylase domain-containing protein [Flavobacterium frigidarium]|uniref:site-specific DNA-methyltransferase (adenine-specific) n=1 Tax=Flavobacterium frigidarium TaxID=99286 RepID=A0ABV4K9U6_9FLAO
MSLFQPSVLKKYLSQQDTALVQKAYKKYAKYFHNAVIQENIRNSKEEQFQEGFLRELFVDILGYTLNPAPSFNLTTELKNIKGAKKVDGAILKDGFALAVIELKGTNTKDLESIRQQAFDYKANQTGCVYVITSNFEKLRFYINNAVDYEEFNLFTLTHAEFEIFYLCLAKENILANKPLSIKEASVVEEENITKKFYGDYSVFKRELYRDLVKQNRSNILLNDLPEKTTKLILFQKSQKLIDRFLFILFAEDRGLLAPNSINTVLKEWKALADLDVEMPLYDRYKQYFGYLDTGRKGTDKKEEIFAYNGGLFQPDAILDAIIIDNDLLYRHTLKLSTYDFESQVDVNILGHIFEHSLNEIESVNAEIEGTDFDKQKTKRKKDGVFYTPKYITKYIVDNTIGKLCAEKKQELGIIDEEYAKGRKNRQATTIIKLDQQLKDYREWLLQLTICDPACGSGAFLNQALDFLIREHAYLDELNKQLFGGFFVFPDIENQILEHNIYGVDLNKESIEIAKLSLWLRTAQPKRKLTSLNNNIKCGNSLIDSRAIAGDKAFNWKEQFPDVFAKGGFDVIIGNPPYGAGLNKDEKSYLRKKYAKSYSGFDSYFFFFEKSIDILKNKGFLGFITPNTFLVVESGTPLRKYLIENTLIYSLLETFNVFPDAVVEPMTTILRKGGKTEFFKVFLVDRKSKFSGINEPSTIKLVQSLKNIMDFETTIINYRLEKNSQNLLEKIYKNSKVMSDVISVKAGVKPYERGKGSPEQTAETLKIKPFNNNLALNETYKSCVRGTNIGRYSTSVIDEYISYGPWLAAPRNSQLFSQPKIFMRRTDDNLYSNLDLTGAIGINSVHCIQMVKENNEVELLKILSQLNSKLHNWIFRTQNFHMVGKPMAEVKTVFVQRLPYRKFEESYDNCIITLVNNCIRFNSENKNFLEKFIQYLKQKFSLIKISRKLENWHELSFALFIAELNNAIKTSGQLPLTKKDEIEWMDLFEDYKKQAHTLKSQIESTDKEIDKMVYELYGLSEEEIKIVEQS